MDSNKLPKPQKLEEADREFNGGITAILISIFLICVQWWKPTWWWEESIRSQFFISIIGETMANVVAYTTAIAFIPVGIFLMRSGKKKFDGYLRQRAEEKELQKSSESDESKQQSNNLEDEEV